MDGPATGMFPPPAWANAETPSFAGTKCGDIVQTVQGTTTSFEVLPIGFSTPATWSDVESFTPSDSSGIIWVCNTTGIYNLKFTQHLRITNAPGLFMATTPVLDPVIALSQFYQNVDDGPTPAPRTGVADIFPTNANPGSDANSSTSTQTDPIDSVLMTTCVTPVDFLTSTVISGSVWSISQWYTTTDNTEANSVYMSAYSVDADGVSNPVLISDGSTNTQVLGSTVAYNLVWTQAVASTFVADLTKRIQFRMYANFGIASTINLLYEGPYTSNILAGISQNVIIPVVVPIVKDTVNMRMTVTSQTTEFNQVFETSIPVVLEPSETLIYTNAVACTANIDAGSSVACEIVAEAGNCQVESGFVQLPSPLCTFQWNLIAQGAYGNVGVIV